MFERFTQQAQQVVVGAQNEATGLWHDHIGPEHLLLSLLGDPDGGPAQSLAPLCIGLLREESGLGPDALVRLGGNLGDVRDQVHQFLGVPARRRGWVRPRPGRASR